MSSAADEIAVIYAPSTRAMFAPAHARRRRSHLSRTRAAGRMSLRRSPTTITAPRSYTTRWDLTLPREYDRPMRVVATTSRSTFADRRATVHRLDERVAGPG